VTVIHGALLLAVHEHPEAVVTDVVLLPPSCPMDLLVGLIEYVHPAACVTVNV